jgi:DNA-binding Lrp family transcriptional regulator
LDKSFLISLKSSFFTRRYLIDSYDMKEFIYTSSDKEDYVLDEVEIKILKHISNNARISIVDLMKETSLSKDIVIYRLKKLEKNNIIEQYRVLIDLNINIYKITLKLRKFNDDVFNNLKDFVSNHKYGIQIIYLIGNWDCEFEFEAESEEGIQKILFELKNKFSDIILDYDIIRVYKSCKLDFFPF